SQRRRLLLAGRAGEPVPQRRRVLLLVDPGAGVRNPGDTVAHTGPPGPAQMCAERITGHASEQGVGKGTVGTSRIGPSQYFDGFEEACGRTPPVHDSLGAAAVGGYPVAVAVQAV